VVEQIEIAAKYSGYIERQKDEVERAAHYENLRLLQREWAGKGKLLDVGSGGVCPAWSSRSCGPTSR
jgi:hypothetical protein